MVVTESDAQSLIETVPSTRTEVIITMAFELGLLLAVTGIAARDVHQRIPLCAHSAQPPGPGLDYSRDAMTRRPRVLE